MPVKQAVALALRSSKDPSTVLAVLRPEDDAELAGVWGLPAGSLRLGEGPEDAAARVAREKLGGGLRLSGVLAKGEQQRPGHVLSMTLYEGRLLDEAPSLPDQCACPELGVTYYASWRWADPALLEEAARQGSLCCQLFLSALSRSTLVSF
ncbi:MAG: NUDIX hydrolase [Chloroflexi bacterium]|nr:NUDIX hydrolase [Chloroflexota bacterium]